MKEHSNSMLTNSVWILGLAYSKLKQPVKQWQQENSPVANTPQHMRKPTVDDVTHT